MTGSPNKCSTPSSMKESETKEDLDSNTRMKYEVERELLLRDSILAVIISQQLTPENHRFTPSFLNFLSSEQDAITLES